MSLCSVPGCKYLKAKKGKVSLFRPKDEMRIKLWQDALPDVKVDRGFRICSRHFKKDDIEKFFPGILLPDGTRVKELIKRERPTLKPSAVPIYYLGGCNPRPPPKTSKNKTKLKKSFSVIKKNPVNDPETLVVLCQCNSDRPSNLFEADVTLNEYTSRLASVNLPNRKWEIFGMENKIFVVHKRRREGALVADKAIVLEARKNPLVFLNGVLIMDTPHDVDLGELIDEVHLTKACTSDNETGKCAGVNRTKSSLCLPCQHLK